MPPRKSNTGRNAISTPDKNATSTSTQRPQLTHFLCLPLTTLSSRPVLETSLARFKTEARELVEADLDDPDASKQVKAEKQALLDVLREGGTAVRPVGTLHLTLGVMTLRDGEGRSDGGAGTGDCEQVGKSVHDAITLLRELDVAAMLCGPADSDHRASKTGDQGAEPVKIDLMGLKSMHSPSKTSCLYTAPSDHSRRLLPFCERLKDVFVEHGLMLDESGKGRKELKLHVTVLNTIYARSTGRRQKPTSGLKTTADGTMADGALTVNEEAADQRDREHDQDTSDEDDAKSGPFQAQKRARKGPLRFNVRGLLDCFEDFEWAKDFRLDRIAICKMGAKKIFDDHGNVVDEAYEEIASRALP